MAGIEHRSNTPIYHDALDCRACPHGAAERFAPYGQSPRHYRKHKLCQVAGRNWRLFEEPLAQGSFDFMKSRSYPYLENVPTCAVVSKTIVWL